MAVRTLVDVDRPLLRIADLCGEHRVERVDAPGEVAGAHRFTLTCERDGEYARALMADEEANEVLWWMELRNAQHRAAVYEQEVLRLRVLITETAAKVLPTR